MSQQAPVELSPELIAQLAELGDDSSRREFLRTNPNLEQQAAVLRITEEVVKAAREDVGRADQLAQVACWLAEVLEDDFSRARSARALGHLLALKGEHSAALDSYQRAVELFERLGEETEAGITLSSSLQPLIYLSRYEEAFALAERARAIFKRQGDRLRLARLDVNLANILHRQDRFEDALVLYGRAKDTLEQAGEHRDAAIVLANMAVSRISLHDFASALEAYEQARAYCQQHDMPLLAAQADYNIAYLYYLRGEYLRAIELYQASRSFCERVGDGYHRALCDLDQSEMYLDLNLPQEAAQLAQQAFSSFEQMKMGYEAAKALAFLGIAANQERKPFRALEFFAKARERFVAEKNWVWPALLDLYQGLVLYHEGRLYEARRSCDAALRFFSPSSLAGKAVVAELLRASLHIAAGANTEARYWCDAALRRAERSRNPSLLQLAYFVLGKFQETQRETRSAYESYQRALAALESLPSQRPVEELKIAFVPEKFELYESLVATGLAQDEPDPEAAFATIEKAKSRQLAELIAFRAHTLPAPSGTRSGLVEQVKSLREELNWYYRQIDLEELRGEKGSSESVDRLRGRTREHESQLLKTLGELQNTDEEFLSLLGAGTISLENVRRVLPADSVLLEYYQARGTIYACALDQTKLQAAALTPASRVAHLLRLLQEQFSKFRLGPEYIRRHADSIQQATQQPLHELYQELVGPLRSLLTGKRLLIVPHGFLHYLPFHALHDGEQYLTEQHPISYASSASVYYLCCTKQNPSGERTLAVGLSKGGSQSVKEEIETIVSAIPDARALTGTQFSEELLNDPGAGCRYLHLSTEVAFRQDNPLFSTLRLGDTQFSLFDLYHLRLPCELVTLSGCGPGLYGGGNGDELVGMIRGFLYAGAQTVVTPLWNAPGPSTSQLLQAFYSRVQQASDRSEALQKAMGEVREAYPHPYYWAPFVLHGKIKAAEPI